MPADRRSSSGVDVYALPTAIGGGAGDIVEVLEASRWVERSGTPVFLFRGPGRPLPAGVEGRWPARRVVHRLLRKHPRAVTLSAQFGVTAEEERSGPLGRPGPWAPEAAAIEATYGVEATLHLSFEEFARTLTAPQQVDERYREGGVAAGDPRRPRSGAARRAEVEVARAAYRRFRSFDRPNLLTIFPTFVRSPGFAREFPESVQAGPLRPADASSTWSPRSGPRRVVWYASPASSDRLVPGLADAMDHMPGGFHLRMRSSRPLPFPVRSRPNVAQIPVQGDREWGREWDQARLVIVTGSRSLLEVLHRRVPFLYFNGVSGTAARTRRHRPEKILGLLTLLQLSGASAQLRRDLDRFSRAQSVEAIVRRALAGPPRRAQAWPWSIGFPPAFRSAERLVVELVGRFGRSEATAPELVRAVRTESRGDPFSQV